MLRTTLLASAMAVGATGAYAVTFDFEEFANGALVESFSAGGISATVTVDSNGSVDEAIVFDTSLTGTADPDLEGPFTGTGPADPGNILIISEGGPTPDDERLGGEIFIEFDQPVDFLSFDAFDGGFFEVTSSFGDSFLVADTIVTGDNIANTLEVDGFVGITTLTFSFEDSGEGASGGIDNIVVEPTVAAEIPVPAALPLMLGGLGIMGFMAARRRR